MTARAPALKVSEVAAELGVSRDYVRAEIRARRMGALNLSQSRTHPRYRVTRAQLDRWIERRERRPHERRRIAAA